MIFISGMKRFHMSRFDIFSIIIDRYLRELITEQ